MPSSRDEAQRKADLDWLYGRQPDAADHTRILQDAEQAELERRSARTAGTPASTEPRGSAGTDAAAAPRGASVAVGAHEPIGAGPAAPVAGAFPAGSADMVQSPDAADATTVRRPEGRRRPVAKASSGSTEAGSGRRGGGAPPPPSTTTAAGAGGGPRSRRHWPRKRIILGVVGLLIAWLIYLVVVPLYAWSSMKQVDATPAGDRPSSQPGTAILLIGSDSRDNLTEAEKRKLRTGSDEGSRTDTMMILYIPQHGKSVLVSLPRDSYVPIPGHGSSKINAAYSIGGPKLMMQTVEQDTGVRLDGYLEIGMGGFSNVIDSLGGIRMCLKQPMVDQYAHINLKAGCQKLAGPQALGYVRMRHADPLGDLGRVQRQRQMLSAVASKIASPATVINPFKYWSVSMSVRDALSRQGLGVGQLPGISSGLMNVAKGKGLQLTVPISNSNYQTSAGDAVLWDHDKALQLFHDIQKGDTGDLAQFAK